MRKASKISTPDVQIENARHTPLGITIETLQDKVFAMEELYKTLVNAGNESANIVRAMLEAIDSVTEEYELVK